MASFGTEDFRGDLPLVTAPALVIHRAPHGCNVSHATEFNDALLSFLTA